MGVPVVTLLGRRHGERTSYSILANLGVTTTVAASGSEYVDIAERLATDAVFMREVRAAIRDGTPAFGADRHAGAHARARARLCRGAGGEGARRAGTAAEATRWLTRGSRRPRPACAAAGANEARAAAHGRARDVRARRPTTAGPRCSCARRPAKRSGDPHGAIDDLELAIAAIRAMPRLRNALGILLADSGDAQGAIDALTIAVGLDPAYARAWNNLANALRSGGRIAEARGAARHAVAAQPDYALAWSNLGAILLDLGDDAGAREAFRRALALQTRPAHDAGARRRSRASAATSTRPIDLYGARDAAAPGDTNTLLSLAGALAERDDLTPQSRSVMLEARARHPQLLRAAFGEALAADGVSGRGGRRRRARTLRRRPRAARSRGSRAGSRPPFADVIDDLRWTNFLLAYQGEDDRELQTRFAAFMARAIDAVAPEWRVPRGAAGGRQALARRFRVVVLHRRDVRPLLPELDRRARPRALRDLRLQRAARRDAVPAGACAHVDRVRTFPGAALASVGDRAAIRADALDALVYPELGMDGTTFALAALRLAPVQCPRGAIR